MTQLAQGLGLNLADTLSCNIKLLTHFFQCAGTSIIHAKPETKYLLLSLCQCIKHLVKLLL